jgi:hypothetical protein
MTDPETTERMLRGEPAGPPHLAALLAAASADLHTEDLHGEEVAVAAFRAAQSAHAPQRKRRRLSMLVSVKAALIGLLLLGGGVTAVAATSTHLPGPLRTKHSRSSHPPATSQTTVEPRTSSHPTPSPHGKKTAQPSRHPHPAKKPKAKHPKGTPHEPHGAGGTVPAPKTTHTAPGLAVTHTPARTVSR